MTKHPNLLDLPSDGTSFSMLDSALLDLWNKLRRSMFPLDLSKMTYLFLELESRVGITYGLLQDSFIHHSFLILKRTNDTEYNTQQGEATVDPLHVRFINSNLAITIYSLAYILQDNISCFQK